MGEMRKYTPPDVIQQANDVVFNKFVKDIQHGVGCGCGQCMGQARSSYEWFVGGTSLTPEKEDEAIKGIAEITKGGILLDLTKRREQNVQPEQPEPPTPPKPAA